MTDRDPKPPNSDDNNAENEVFGEISADSPVDPMPQPHPPHPPAGDTVSGSMGSSGSPASGSPASGAQASGAPASGSADRTGKKGNGAAPKPKKKHLFAKWFTIAALVAIVIFTIWAWVATSMSYATQQFTGYVQSFKRQGWLCKTWEGQMVVSTIPGSPPQILEFTVKNDSLASALQEAVNQRIVLTVDQHRGVPSSCFGETQTYVKDFHVSPF